MNIILDFIGRNWLWILLGISLLVGIIRKYRRYIDHKANKQLIKYLKEQERNNNYRQF